MKVSCIKKELQKYSNAKRKETNEWFFKTGKGEYGEGDIFIGIRVPDIRKVTKKFADVDFKILQELLYSKIHEERLLALLILVEQTKVSVKRQNVAEQRKIVRFYLKHRRQVNNWDLVDLSTHYILGQVILDGLESEKILDKYSQAKSMWERRMSIVSTWIIIRTGNIKPTLRISKKLLGDKEDLIHKAVGWMLREAWKKDSKKVEAFLIKNYKQLPRTTLRYAIERIEEKKRKRFLKGKF